MLHYDRINVSEGIDIAKSKNGKERIICYYRCLIMGLNFKIPYVMVVIIC